jgi:2-polyprenyl-6-methoxyphenol hydroxylase-like FAD-dependent oxidoreductase
MSRQIGDHAVVLGASMAGLAAARVLADAYERVTVLDATRSLPAPPTARASPRAATPTPSWPGAGSRWRSCSPA